MKSKSVMNRFTFAVFAAMALVLAGCASPGYNSGYGDRGYGDRGYGSNTPSSMRGTVQRIQEDYVRGGRDNSATIGTVIGAVVGAAAGNQVGKGDGRKAATVGGAVAGGVIGHQVGAHQGGDKRVWRIELRLDDGRYATVTQDSAPNVRVGDYVEIRNNRVYRR